MVDMEEESVEGVFEDRPDDVSGEKASHGRQEGGLRRGGEVRRRPCEERSGGDRAVLLACFDRTSNDSLPVIELLQREGEEESGDRTPEERYDIPLRTCERLHISCCSTERHRS